MNREGGRIVQCAVRHGGPLGKVIGWIQERNSGYTFSYDPGWVYAECPIPLDLEMMPIQADRIWESDGLSFNGPLALFDRIQPGRFAESTCFAWLAEEARKLGATPLEAAPSTPLARLVWMSHLRTFEPDAWGIFFDPSAPYPEGPARMWLPDPLPSNHKSAAWHQLQRAIQPRNTDLRANWASLQVRGDGQSNVERQFFSRIAPLPGETLRIRSNVREGQYLTRVGVSVNSCRALRLKSAYLMLAEQCGIRVAHHSLKAAGVVPGVEGSGRDLLMIRATVSRRSAARVAENGLVDWAPQLNELSALPYPAAQVDEKIFDQRAAGPRSWLADTMDVAKFRKGPPIRRIVRLYRLACEQGHEFDREEACRRLIFSAYTGSMLGDDSPILLQGSQVQKDDGSSVVRWSFPPLAHITPMMLPMRSKQAAGREIAEFITGHIKILDYQEEDPVYLRILAEVEKGMTRWEEIAQNRGLNEWENGGIMPMYSCDAIRKNKRGRKARVSGEPAPDYLAEAQRMADGAAGEANEYSSA